MQKRLLSQGALLWSQGDHARTIALVETGKLGVRTEDGIVGVALPGTVVGEAALMSGPEGRRRADVFALEPETSVGEFPVEMLRETFGVGVPRKVLRTLFAQICASALTIIGSHPGNPVVETALMSLMKGMADCEERVRGIKDWEDFLAAFRLLYHLRDGCEAMRKALVPPDALTSEAALRISSTTKAIFKAEDAAAFIQGLVDAERAHARR